MSGKKFYSGLPPNMMERQSGPNRQRSNFFWPDESDVESATETKTKRHREKMQSYNYQSNQYGSPTSPVDSDVEPKELFKKQLESKITFYDNIDNGIQNGKMINNSSSNKGGEYYSSSSKTASSKLDYYEPSVEKATIMRTDVNSKKDVERNTKNSPKLIDKRIKFIDISTCDPENLSPTANLATPKGILKNNPDKLLETSSSKKNKNSGGNSVKRRGLTKKSLSKSVENLTTKPKFFSDDEDDDEEDIHYKQRQIENNMKILNIASNNLKAKSDGVSTHWNESANTTHNNEREYMCEVASKNSFVSAESGSSHNRIFLNGDVREQFSDGNGNEKFYTETKYVNRKEVLDNGVYNKEEFGEHNVDSSDVGQNRRNMWQTNENVNLNNHLSQSNEKSYTAESPYMQNSETSSNAYNNYSNTPTNITSPEVSYTPVTRNFHPKRHLMSSFSFTDDPPRETDYKTVKSARNAAVSRVSVGLPEY